MPPYLPIIDSLLIQQILSTPKATTVIYRALNMRQVTKHFTSIVSFFLTSYRIGAAIKTVLQVRKLRPRNTK